MSRLGTMLPGRLWPALTGLAAVAVVGFALLAGSFLSSDPSSAVIVAPVSSGERARVRAEAGATPPADITLHTLEALRQRYGDPPGANAGRMKIPAINVDAPIGSRSVAKDGVLHDPIGPSDVVWYNFAALPKYGGVPGTGRNAVFAGHVDRTGHLDYAGVEYSGPGIFFWLDRLHEGDIIEVTMRGKTLRYAVDWAREVPATDNKEWERILGADVGADAITLITCGGDFDRAKQEYASRLVVRASRG